MSTSGTAADWIVKVVDEYPGEPPGDATEAEQQAWPGHRQQLVRAEAFRGRFRESYSDPKPFEPDVPAQVRFELLDVLHTFRRGHRIQVQIQSTWFPFIDRNPQTWVPNIFEASEEDFRARTHRVHRSAELPSKLTIGVLPDGGATAVRNPPSAALAGSRAARRGQRSCRLKSGARSPRKPLPPGGPRKMKPEATKPSCIFRP